MRIRRNVALNIAGFLIPAAVLFFAYPQFLRILGAERFGILALAMSLAAGLSFLDLGLSAASIRFVVADLHRGDLHAAARVVTTTLTFFAALGILISGLLFLASPLLVNWLHVSHTQQSEAVLIFRVTAVQVAFSLFVNTLAGLFKAFDRFDMATVLVSLLAILMYGVPAVQIDWMHHDLITALNTAVGLLAGLSIVGLLHINRLARANGIELSGSPPDRGTFRRVFSFGATLTLHALIGMAFSHGQRILVGFIYGPAALAAYQLVLTLVSKVHAGINSAAEIALPIASSSQHDLIKKTYAKGIVVLAGIVLVPLSLIVVGNRLIADLWLGDAAPIGFSELVAPVCVAYFFVAMSALPYHVLNGLGQPRINVLFAVFNIAAYFISLVALWVAGYRNVYWVAVSFAISNVLCGVGYQYYCGKVVQRLKGRAEIDAAVLA